MTEKHTPGPWENSLCMIGKTIDGDTWLHIADVSEDEQINYRRDNPFPLGTGQANAHLINASPELLEELVKAREIVIKWCHYQGTHQDLFDTYVKPIDDVIAKARGE